MPRHPTESRFMQILLDAMKFNEISDLEHTREYLPPKILINDEKYSHVQYYKNKMQYLWREDITVPQQPTCETVDQYLYSLYETT